MIPSAIRAPAPVGAAARAEVPTPRLAEPTAFEHSWSSPPPANPTEQGAGNLGRFLSYLKHHWVVILFLGAVLGAGFAYAAWNLIPSKFTTYALLRVSLRQEDVAFQTEEPFSRYDFNTYLMTQAQLIKSQYVLTAALRDPEIANLPMLKEELDPIRFLEEKIQVDYTDGSEIIKVSLTSDDANQIAKIVNAVQSAYYREIVEVEQHRKRDRLRNLQDARKKMEDDLKKRYDAIASSDEPLILTDDGDIKLANQRAAGQLMKMQDRLFAVDTQIAALKRRVADLQHALDASGSADVPELEIEAALKADGNYQGEVQRIKATCEQLESRADYFASIAANPNSAQVRSLRDKAKRMHDEIATLREAKVNELKQSNTLIERHGITQALSQAQAELIEQEEIRKVAQTEIVRQERLIKPEQPMSGEVIVAKQSPDMVRTEIEKRREKIEEVIGKIQVLELEVKAPARVQKLQEAAVPRQKEFKKQALGTGFAGIMGFVLVGLGVIAYESRLKRVMSLNDVKQSAAGPVLGVLPYTAGADGESAGGTPAWANTRQLTEAIDKTRTVTMLGAEPGRPFTLMITSAGTDEGKSFLSWKLTLSLAKAGYRTLLIDADLRLPSLHESIGIPNDCGVCEILRGEADLRTSIQPVNEGLSFLPAGKWDERVRQDLAGDKVATFLARVREPFDVIVIHAHPILSVTDTFLIGRHTDATLLTVQRNVSRMPLLGRAQDRVMAMNQPSGFGLVYLGATEDEAMI